MLQLLHKYRWSFLCGTLAAVIFRLIFVLKNPVIAGDSLIYGDIAKSLLNHHVFGMHTLGGEQPTLIRLPGYPFYLAFTFLLFGQDHYLGAMLFQLVFDVLTCFLIADIARRVISDRAARIAFWLTALNPFLANYVGTALTETLEIFFTAAAIDAAILGFDSRRKRWWAVCGAAVACAILLRPDGGLLLGCIGIPMLWPLLRERTRMREMLTAIVLLGAVSLAPLVPWAIRNWRTFHVFQPLVSFHATDPGEFIPHGWERWLRTWLVDYASIEDISFKVPGEPIDIGDVPDRAYDSSEERAYVRQLFDEYNDGNDMTVELDRKFGELATEKTRRHPLRVHVLLPIARMLDMWFRARTEMLPLDTHFWEFKQDPRDAILGTGLAVWNFLYVAAAVAFAWKGRKVVRYLPLLITYPIVRSVFLAGTGAAEDRYTLECFPFVLVLCAGFLAWFTARREMSSQSRV